MTLKIAGTVPSRVSRRKDKDELTDQGESGCPAMLSQTQYCESMAGQPTFDYRLHPFGVQCGDKMRHIVSRLRDVRVALFCSGE
jgi:hypothetical protein